MISNAQKGDEAAVEELANRLGVDADDRFVGELMESSSKSLLQRLEGVKAVDVSIRRAVRPRL